jgi:hypothetical protein
VRRSARVKLDLLIPHPDREQKRKADGEHGENDGRLTATNRGGRRERRAEGDWRRGNGTSKNWETSGCEMEDWACHSKLGGRLSQDENFPVTAFPGGSEFVSCADNAHKGQLEVSFGRVRSQNVMLNRSPSTSASV